MVPPVPTNESVDRAIGIGPDFGAGGLEMDAGVRCIVDLVGEIPVRVDALDEVDDAIARAGCDRHLARDRTTPALK